MRARSAAREPTMTYYEELGIDSTAAPEEIRKAYKRLVRLLHPDRCRDTELKRLADIQMKRLNGILVALTDPTRRAEYDRLQLEAPQEPHERRNRGSRPPQWFWMAAAVLIAAGLLLLPHTPAPPPPPPTAVPPTDDPHPPN